MKLTVRIALTLVCVSVAVVLRAQHPQPGQHHDDHHDVQLPHMEHRFDDVERYARSFDDPERDQWQMPDRVIDALALRAGQTVADIGAGTGYFTVRLAKAAAAPRVYAVDIEPAMVQYVRQRAAKEGLSNVIAVQAGSEGPNLPEPVDLVLIVDTYHHIPSRVEYFSALRKSIKPGGRLAIIDFRKGVPGGPPDEFRFTTDQISGELADAGFVLQQQHEFLPRQIFLVYQVK